ncbi:RNase H-like domain found in reverse transcriptase [Popillia japonica]|uniref:RNase H-like domain found in reverse transcriptase n=1 Tax=Popillia japonica TaxID=7064 RepID=A0AAW1IFE9_POPJA
MEGFKTPKSLAIDENIVSNWKKFVQSYNIYLLASGSANKSAEVRAAIFLNFIGEDAIDLFNTFNLAEEDKKDVEKIKKAFEEYIDPRKNRLCATCEFTNKEEMLRDRIANHFKQCCKKKKIHVQEVTETNLESLFEINDITTADQHNEIKFCGHIYNKNGVKPDNEHVKAILELKNPTSKVELQRMLGLINYLREFIPNLASLTEPLRELLKKDNLFVWNSKHTEALKRLKLIISDLPTLRHFDPNKDITIQCDALIFACRKFHYYIYGRQITAFTDHAPLVSIMKKDISMIPNNFYRSCTIGLNNEKGYIYDS